MEKFEVYLFDGIFYTKEELEKIGLNLYSTRELFDFISSMKFHQDYEIIMHGQFYKCNITLWSLAKRFDETKIFGFKNYVKYGKMVPFSKFYGVRYKGSTFITTDYKKRDECFDEVYQMLDLNKDIINDLNFQLEIQRKISSFHCDNHQQIYDSQNKIKQNKSKLLKIIPKSLFESDYQSI